MDGSIPPSVDCPNLLLTPDKLGVFFVINISCYNISSSADNYIKAMNTWLEVAAEGICLLEIDLDKIIKVIVKQTKEILTIQLSISEHQIAEILFPSIKIYCAISACPPQCEIIYHKFFNRKYHWIVKDGSIAKNVNSLNGTFVDGIRLLDYEIKKLQHNNTITFAGQPHPSIKFCDLTKNRSAHEKDSI